MSIIKENRIMFEKLATHVFAPLERDNDNKIILSSIIASTSAWQSFPGFYCHPEMEEILYQIARKIQYHTKDFKYYIPSSIEDSRRILHVFSTTYAVGGHTKVAERWMKNKLRNERHAIVITNQKELGNSYPVPAWLIQATEEAGGVCIEIEDSYSMVDRAAALRSIAYEWADLIVLHIHPNDPIPLIAFGVPGGPPVLFLNHADHVFWLGSGVADVVLDIRESGNLLTHSKRFARNATVLPLPLDEVKIKDKKYFRERLGIHKDQTVLLSIASSYKYEPIGEYNFIKSSIELLKRNPDIILLVVGPSAQHPLWQNAYNESEGKIIATGTQNDLVPFYSVADIYLESFPVGSATAALDACLYGIPVVKSPSPLSPLFSMSNYDGMKEHASNFEDYFLQIEEYINNSEYRVSCGITQKQDVEKNHVGASWNNKLEKVMSNVPKSHIVGFGNNLKESDNFVGDHDAVLSILNQHKQRLLQDAYIKHYFPQILF
ncbi:hypothetical protein AB432_027640 [Brevibacillus brevis]|uniref:Glycosyltransferase n=1 Tax=Brevibacillus brevis TaxID=1393 RepID=A0A2Z4MQE1_BREBE|nr:hypothetical protein [Brevibacillus brevis]AWX58581.1 hypothetical protein AB432_027640 [Brevibacillus brevis]